MNVGEDSVLFSSIFQLSKIEIISHLGSFELQPPPKTKQKAGPVRWLSE